MVAQSLEQLTGLVYQILPHVSRFNFNCVRYICLQ